MKTSEYLYGKHFDGILLREMSYASALHRKLLWSQELIEELNDAPLMERDMRRINDSLNAQKFNKALLDECYYKEKE